jgi:hypothetical protein
MSCTWHLVCPEIDTEIWIGQGNEVLKVFYTGKDSTMENLRRFLALTQGKNLVLKECNDLDFDTVNFEHTDLAVKDDDL